MRLKKQAGGKGWRWLVAGICCVTFRIELQENRSNGATATLVLSINLLLVGHWGVARSPAANQDEFGICKIRGKDSQPANFPSPAVWFDTNNSTRPLRNSRYHSAEISTPETRSPILADTHHAPQLPTATMTERTHRADERRFLDERGSNFSLAPNGLNPATIMEKAVRERIVDSYFYKEQCFAVNEADIVNRVVDHVYFVGGTYGSAQKPTPFLCLAFKLLQLSPRDDILREYLKFGGEKFKYLRALAVFYIRLTRRAKDVYTLLEPYLEDRRKLRRKGRAGTTLTYMDEFVDDLLVKDRVCGTSLWKMPSRDLLEDLDELEPRVSPLGDIEDLLEEDEDNNMENGHASEDDRGSGRTSDSERRSPDDEDRLRDQMEVDREGTPEIRDRSP